MVSSENTPIKIMNADQKASAQKKRETNNQTCAVAVDTQALSIKKNRKFSNIAIT